MRTVIKAVIFDMDGVLIDSEPLWRRAMIKGFQEFGMPVTIEECKQTMGMRITEVIAIWLKHFKITQVANHTIEERIMELLLELIELEGRFIEGIPEM
jgi:beta-phosphoglucomutase-like phosphatase (HAD superfamily)